MRKNLISLHLQGLEDYSDFKEIQQYTSSLSKAIVLDEEDLTALEAIEGSEGLSEALSKVGEVSFPILKKIASGTLSGVKLATKQGMVLANKAVRESTLQIKKVIDNNNYYLKEIIRQLPDDLEVTITDTSKVTVDGDDTDFVRTSRVYVKTMDSLSHHSEALLDMMKSRMSLLESISNKTTEKDIMTLLDKLTNYEYPTLKLAYKEHDVYTSETLPGGKYISFAFINDLPKYVIQAEKPVSSSVTLAYSKSEATSVIKELISLNDKLQQVKKSQDKFLDVMKTWNAMSLKVNNVLIDNDILSSQTKSDVKSKLSFNNSVLSFYGTTYPEVGGNVDNYIINLAGGFSKSI